ncbi:hypothetical protein F5Y06DRAFT_117464 [Hypoxylon sp. FL0890]|nr:hypothetical protein F5Y06DRAFT_117464 [Hypoxylon sp. FL0890]
MSTVTVQSEPVNPNDLGIGPLTMGITWVLTAGCIVSMGFRFYLRRKFVRTFFKEDWFMLVAFILLLVYQAFQTKAYTYGLGKAHYNLYPAENVQLQKWLWIIQTVGIFVGVLSRISIGMLLVHLFDIRHAFKWFTICFTTLVVINGVLAIIFAWAQIYPIQATWDPTIQASRRWDTKISQYTGLVLQALYFISDISFVLWPVIIIWKLNMALRRKVGLVILVGLSLITAGASLAKLVISCMLLTQTPFVGGNGTFDFAAGLVSFCTSIELSLVIILGCVPTLGPIVNLHFPTFSHLRSSFSSIVTKVTRKGSRSDLSSQGASYRSGSYRHLETALKLRPSADEKGSVVVASPANTQDQAMKSSGDIHRSDTYSVAYDTRVRATEEV